MAELYLIRHPKTGYNAEGHERVRSHLGVRPSAEKLREWLDHVAPYLDGKGVRFVASSDLPRGKIGGQALADHLGVRLIATPEMNTWRSGDVEGELYKDVEPIMRHFMEHPDETPPGGERSGQFVKRWGTTLDKLKEYIRRTQRTGAAIVHGNQLMTLDHVNEGAPLRYVPHDKLPRPGAIFVINLPRLPASSTATAGEPRS